MKICLKIIEINLVRILRNPQMWYVEKCAFLLAVKVSILKKWLVRFFEISIRKKRNKCQNFTLTDSQNYITIRWIDLEKIDRENEHVHVCTFNGENEGFSKITVS